MKDKLQFNIFRKNSELKNLLLLIAVFSLASCVSVKKFNAHLDTKISPELLKNDVDFAYQKLQKLHPHLYDYIAKKELDFKFDSLKQTINSPLSPNDFYMKLAPVIGEVRQGHLQLRPLSKKLERKERKKLKDQKGLFSRFGYYVDDEKLFIKDNAEKLYDIKPGSEILEINSVPSKEILDRYLPLITSDGYNTTYHDYALARRWAAQYTIENGIADSALIKIKAGDDERNIVLKRETKTKKEKKDEKADKKKDEEKRTKDYNPVTKSFNRSLHFLDKEKKIAYVRIKTFSGTKSRKFYRETFREIKEKNADYLILDVRDNLGGSLYEINNLYSYLVSDEFKFINDIEVTSRSAMFQADYLANFPILVKPLAIIVYPFYLVGTALSTKKVNEKIYLRNNGIFALKKPKKNNFKGKVYVLINGSSFSAASILPSKLKDEKRAFLVGEETGGANDGTVAGRYSTEKLKNSKLYLPIGLMLIQPNIKFTQTKKGVVPDKEIIPTLEEILQKKDVQLDWAMAEINKENPSRF